ncbi:helix-turn-helix transcriptional regulator [Catenulispora pinisilvae]|uniref:helix-turn-helix transcriptional regulator n=1 Tax=Catenulispora pinisilvae TaxID=2705253 RepID=UPI0018920EB3|nr:helix-turn-helix transcriptional regulator [Catenulispora pinisilvae]
MAGKRVKFAKRRKAAGFTQEQLALYLGVERSTVVRWESAENEPQAWLRPKLARALRVSADELQALLDDIAVIQSEPGERLAYVLQHPSSVDLVAVAHLHERIRQLDESYDTATSTALVGVAGHVHGQITYLRQGATGGRVRRALGEVEAESATFMGQLVWDVSQRRDHDGPIKYFDQAVNAARQVRDPLTESYAVLRKSFVALYGEKDPAKGLALADEAAEVASLCSPALTGLSLLHVAEGCAMAGDRKETEAVLGKAEAQFDRVTPDDAAADNFGPNEFNRLAGSCFLSLGLPNLAEPLLRRTVSALVTKKKSQSIAFGNLTLSLIRQGKRDEAQAAMHHTIDAVELTRGGGGLNIVFQAGRELRPWRSEPWVQEINDRLLALMAAI